MMTSTGEKRSMYPRPTGTPTIDLTRALSLLQPAAYSLVLERRLEARWVVSEMPLLDIQAPISISISD